MHNKSVCVGECADTRGALLLCTCACVLGAGISRLDGSPLCPPASAALLPATLDAFLLIGMCPSPARSWLWWGKGQRVRMWRACQAQVRDGAAILPWALGRGRDADSGNLAAEQHQCGAAWGPACCVTAVALAQVPAAAMDPGGFAGLRAG